MENCENHSFYVKTYKRPTSCDVCQKMLWGISRQGMHCSHCSTNVHKHCSTRACKDISCTISEGVPRRHSSVDLGRLESESESPTAPVESTVTVNKVLSLESLRSRFSDRQTSSTPVFFTPTDDLAPPSPAESLAFSEVGSASGVSIRNDRKIPGAAVLRELIETTAIKAAELQRSPRGPAKLNVFTTLPKNYIKFVNKVGPLADLQNKVEAIFRWDNPTETFLVISIYSLLCLNPYLVFLIPHIALVGLIGYNYYVRAKKKAKPKRKRNHSKMKSEPPRVKPIDPSSIYPDQISYKKNMQFIQNTMGMYCDIYESLMVLNHHIDWSDESKTTLILQIAIGTLTVMIIASNLIPWNYVFLFIGLAIFGLNTAIGHALIAVVSRNLQCVLGYFDLNKITIALLGKDTEEEDDSFVTLNELEEDIPLVVDEDF